MKIEPILLTTVRVQTFLGAAHLTNATAFFFERGASLFLVTSRHVLQDEVTRHVPDRITIDLHVGEEESIAVTGFSIPLFQNGLSAWRAGSDAAGDVDVAMIEIDRSALPANTLYRAFSPAHLAQDLESIEVGSPLLVVGFPLGFHDSLHHLPIVRQAVIASSFGLRFQGQGYFLTDARTHRGTSGAPVVMRRPASPGATAELPWLLLGIHSTRLDVGTRDQLLDEALGLNCAWYADILMALSADRPAEAPKRAGPR
jgi:S1-C subfamily serine protease